MSARPHVWRSEDTILESDLSFYHVRPRLEPSSSGWPTSTFYPMSHFSVPRLVVLRGAFCCFKEVSGRVWRHTWFLQQKKDAVSIWCVTDTMPLQIHSTVPAKENHHVKCHCHHGIESRGRHWITFLKNDNYLKVWKVNQSNFVKQNIFFPLWWINRLLNPNLSQEWLELNVWSFSFSCLNF